MNHGLKALLRSAGAGRLAYRCFHAPLGAMRRSMAEGGPVEQWRTASGRRAMEAAAHHLPIPTPRAGGSAEVHILTGRRFWYQTAFCLSSLAAHSDRAIRPVIYDDGTLTPEYLAPLQRLFPPLRFVGAAEITARLEAFLPAARFPALRDRWRHYPNIRKLTDPHLGAAGWKLVVDSDLLFFHRPDFLLRWLENPTQPLHAVDIETSYGYPPALLRELAGRPLADRLNVGLCGLRSDALDWEKLEYWCRTLISREGTHYYLEQALVAVLLAGTPCAVAPADDYVTLPRPPEADECRAVMHHYVAGSKTWYFRTNWRRCTSLP